MKIEMGSKRWMICLLAEVCETNVLVDESVKNI